MNLEQDLSQQLSTLDKNVKNETNSEIANYLINYTGQKLNPKDDEVTIGMIIDVLSEEFPTLVLCLSEENWVRGYQQALTDVQEGEKLYNEEIPKIEE